MEYERAVFRIYDKSMELLRFPAARSLCWYAQKTLLILSAALFAVLVVMHGAFVNKPGCLAALIEEAAAREGLLLPPPPPGGTGSSRAPLWVAVDGSDPPAGYTGVVAVNSTTSNGGVADLSPRSNATNSDEAGAEDDTRVVLPSGASMPYDVLIGISIGGFRKPASGGGKEWGLRGSRKSTSNTDGTEGGEGIRRRTEEGEIEEGAGEQRDHHDESHDGSDGDGGDGAAAAVAAQNGTGFEADYTFAFEPMVLLLPDKIRGDHSFQWVNFTLEPSECFSEAGLPARLLAAFVVGYDTVMVNMLMFSARSKGLLRNTVTRADWWWTSGKEAPKGWFLSCLYTLGFKMSVVLRSLLAWMLMSTITAITVRTLLSSGVVLMFPLVMLMQRWGLHVVDIQTLALGYPWLGMPIEFLRSRNKPVGPFIMGHIMQMVVFYSVYNACLLAWSMWLYSKPMTSTLQMWLYGIVMLWEYFALIFVRSRGSIVFYSRAAALSFLAFHVYFYHFQAGYFEIAACSSFAAMFAAEIYVLQSLELPAYMSGEISHDQPRAHYVELPWSTWDAALPPMWSLFIPPNASSNGIYSDAVPNRPGTGDGDDQDRDQDQDEGSGDGGTGSPGRISASVVNVRRGGRSMGRSQQRARARGRGRGPGQGQGQGVGDADEARGERIASGGGSGGRGRRNGGGRGEQAVEMATRRRRPPVRDVDDGDV